VIVLPPLLLGALQPTSAECVAGVALAFVGAAGGAAPVGVTEFDGAETGPDPLALEAWTVKVYAVPEARPATVVLVAGGLPVTVVAACALEPMNGVTV
jgi:hypothetical protein